MLQTQKRVGDDVRWLGSLRRREQWPEPTAESGSRLVNLTDELAVRGTQMNEHVEVDALQACVLVIRDSLWRHNSAHGWIPRMLPRLNQGISVVHSH